MREFIDKETGEIIKISSYRTEDQDKAFRKRKHREQQRGKSFSFTDMDNVEKLREDITLENIDLTTKDLGYFLVLQTYVNFEGILFESEQSKKPMNRTAIGRVLGIKKGATIKKLVDKLLKHEMLLEVDKGYQVNEKFHFKGHTQNKKLVKAFSTKIREVYRDLSPADLGILYMVIPHIHYKSNVICSNPHEMDIRKVNTLSISQLAELTGYTKHELSRRISRMEFGDYIVFSKTIKQGKAHLTINPLVFYRMDGEPRQDIVDTFLIQGK